MLGLTQIDLAHLTVRGDLRGRAFGEDPAAHLTVMRSAKRKTSSMSCSMNTMVTSRGNSEITLNNSALSAAESRPQARRAAGRRLRRQRQRISTSRCLP
jgi:hypothetical protein